MWSRRMTVSKALLCSARRRPISSSRTSSCRQILAESPGTKIIAISGGGRIGNTDFLQIARKMGAVDALPKPFDPDDLLGRIDNCLKAA
jgi:DNA-binding response OmpR family regulator